jgi:hypothetical protein
VPGHRTARRLDLTRGEPSAADRLQPVFAEAHFVADGRNTLVAAFLFLAVLPFSRLQHFLLLLDGCVSVLQVPVPERSQAQRRAPVLRP